MIERNKVLSDSEIQSLKSMGLYWNEVRQRKDIIPLYNESVCRLLGVRLLDLIEHYIMMIEEENKK